MRRNNDMGRKKATATNNNIIYNFDKRNVVEYKFVFHKNALNNEGIGGERIVKEKYRKKKKVNK